MPGPWAAPELEDLLRLTAGDGQVRGRGNGPMPAGRAGHGSCPEPPSCSGFTLTLVAPLAKRGAPCLHLRLSLYKWESSGWGCIQSVPRTENHWWVEMETQCFLPEPTCCVMAKPPGTGCVKKGGECWRQCSCVSRALMCRRVEPQVGERVKEFGEDWTLVVMSLGRERD